ncbi:S8 family serine peptidase [Aromatoleum bremense]|uniref:S8 family serine peptidase n=2 Tax=Aromatoleum bremense TaxID=76115 RepID=A0ABX1NWE5_9RHOO|nr:S8 family serine peptidase [Aromatoleum bremense]
MRGDLQPACDGVSLRLAVYLQGPNYTTAQRGIVMRIHAQSRAPCNLGEGDWLGVGTGAPLDMGLDGRKPQSFVNYPLYPRLESQVESDKFDLHRKGGVNCMLQRFRGRTLLVGFATSASCRGALWFGVMLILSCLWVPPAKGALLGKTHYSVGLFDAAEDIVRLNREDQAALSGNAEISIIVEYEDDEVLPAVPGASGGLKLPFEAAEVLERRARTYRSRKDQVLQALDKRLVIEVRDYKHLPMSVLRLHTPEALAALLRQPGVRRVHSDVRLKRTLSASLPLIGQPSAVATGRTGSGTAIAILDTGVDYTHPAFGSCAAPGAGCRVAFARDFAPDDFVRDDAIRHGTNVAAIAAAVAPGARIVSLDVFDGEYAWSSHIIAAIDWVIANRAVHNIVAMNLSLGAGRFPVSCGADVFAAPINRARAAGVLASVASGNDAYKAALSTPACVPSAVSVGAVYDDALGTMRWGNCTDTQSRADETTCFSNSADFLVLLAPGAIINAGGIAMGGTSQAAPHVAGAVAVLRAQYPDESPDAIVARLTSSTVRITDTNGISTPRLDLLTALDPPIDAQPVTIGRSGTGSGRVTSTPTGIDCGSVCTGYFQLHGLVTLEAYPESGSVFAGWEGDCSGTLPYCAIALNAPKSVTALFSSMGDGASLSDALDMPDAVWDTSGEAPWHAEVRSGRLAARSGQIGHGQLSLLQTSLAGPGILSFQWRVSSERGYDYLDLYIDDGFANGISGETDWRTVSIPLGTGRYTLSWVFNKDNSVSAGEDAAWVNEVNFVPTMTGSANLVPVQVGSSDVGQPGGAIAVSATISNQGEGTALPFLVRYYLSPDRVIDAGDLDTLQGCTIVGLAQGGNVDCSGSVVIPPDTPPGTYYVGILVDPDNQVAETSDEDNGLAASSEVTISLELSTVTVVPIGAGLGRVTTLPAGIDCGTNCSALFPGGSAIALRAVPVSGSAFAGWSGSCSGMHPECSIVVDGDASIGANFVLSGVDGRALTHRQVIAAMYAAFFDRAPDAAGLAFWLDNMGAGQQGSDIAAGFARHPAFATLYGGLSNSTFVERIYVNMLGNGGDPDGIAYWTSLLDHGLSRSSMVAGLVEGAMLIDLDAMYANGELSQFEYERALVRQRQITNRAVVGQYFVEQFGAVSDLAAQTDPLDLASLERDLAYLASRAVLALVDDTDLSVVRAKTAIDSALTAPDPRTALIDA